MNGVRMRQVAAVFRLEWRRTTLSKRAWWIYLLAAAPVLIALMHWVTMRGARLSHSVGEDSVIYAGLFLFLFLRGTIFFGCVGMFSGLFRGEMLEKTLHYALLTPVRREILVAGKYLAALAASLALFVPSAALTYLMLGRHFGPAWTDYLMNGPGLSQLGYYALVAALACVGYGAVFLLCGLLFRNPMIAAAVVWVWENLNPFLPSFLKKISIIFYLRSLCPVDVPAPPPFSIMAIETNPAPAWLAVAGLLAMAALLLVYAAVDARRAEIDYGE